MEGLLKKIVFFFGGGAIVEAVLIADFLVILAVESREPKSTCPSLPYSHCSHHRLEELQSSYLYRSVMSVIVQVLKYTKFFNECHVVIYKFLTITFF